MFPSFEKQIVIRHQNSPGYRYIDHLWIINKCNTALPVPRAVQYRRHDNCIFLAPLILMNRVTLDGWINLPGHPIRLPAVRGDNPNILVPAL